MRNYTAEYKTALHLYERVRDYINDKFPFKGGLYSKDSTPLKLNDVLEKPNRHKYANCIGHLVSIKSIHRILIVGGADMRTRIVKNRSLVISCVRNKYYNTRISNSLKNKKLFVYIRHLKRVPNIIINKMLLGGISITPKNIFAFGKL